MQSIFTGYLVSVLFAMPVFSGPQPDEALPQFEMLQVFDDVAGQTIDPVETANGRPMLIVFVHKATRPSIALTRLVTTYANKVVAENTTSNEAKSLSAVVCFLSGDRTETTAFLKRARHALPQRALLGISTDGMEGPGAYGLDRNMTLTVLVAKNGVVTDNFALIQPSVAADGPRIGAAIHDVLGIDGKPHLSDLQPKVRRGMASGVKQGMFRSMLAPVIRKDATPNDVKRAARAVEDHAAEHPAFRNRLQEVARRIINAGRLDQYGTPEARVYLKKWANVPGADVPGADVPGADVPGADQQ